MRSYDYQGDPGRSLGLLTGHELLHRACLTPLGRGRDCVPSRGRARYETGAIGIPTQPPRLT
jgi:hypothetical protein